MTCMAWFEGQILLSLHFWDHLVSRTIVVHVEFNINDKDYWSYGISEILLGFLLNIELDIFLRF